MHNLPPLSLPKLVGSEKNDAGVEKNGQAISGEEKQFQSETLPGGCLTLNPVRFRIDFVMLLTFRTFRTALRGLWAHYVSPTRPLQRPRRPECPDS